MKNIQHAITSKTDMFYYINYMCFYFYPDRCLSTIRHTCTFGYIDQKSLITEDSVQWSWATRTCILHRSVDYIIL